MHTKFSWHKNYTHSAIISLLVAVLSACGGFEAEPPSLFPLAAAYKAYLSQPRTEQYDATSTSVTTYINNGYLREKCTGTFTIEKSAAGESTFQGHNALAVRIRQTLVLPDCTFASLGTGATKAWTDYFSPDYAPLGRIYDNSFVNDYGPFTKLFPTEVKGGETGNFWPYRYEVQKNPADPYTVLVSLEHIVSAPSSHINTTLERKVLRLGADGTLTPVSDKMDVAAGFGGMLDLTAK